MPKIAYGLQFPDNITPLQIELHCFKRHVDKLNPLPKTEGGEVHFWKIAAWAWPWNAKRQTGFNRNPWSERIVDAYCRHPYLAISGCGKSGKSDTMAALLLLDWMADPVNTLTLLTSTDLEGGKKRIWGKILKYANAPAFQGGPWLFRNAPPSMKSTHPKATEVSGIYLIPSSPKYAAEACGKIIGLRNKRVRLGADEMSDISQSVVEAAFGNLSTNPYFRMVGMANFCSLYDPFGIFSTPKNGWNNVSPDSGTWETARGACLQLDGMEAYEINPEGELPILSGAKIDEQYGPNPERDPKFWRFVRSFPIPSGSEFTVFSEADIESTGSREPVIWKYEPTVICGVDPSFTANGDRAIAYFAKVGTDKDDKWRICFDEAVILKADATLLAEVPASYQRISQFIKEAEARGLKPENCAVDVTGGGRAFCDTLEMEWESGFIAVPFGGKATDDPVSQSDERPCHEVYENMATQLWFDTKTYLDYQQIRNVTIDLAKELCARRLDQNSGKRLRLESKSDMIKSASRMRDRSPDLADAAVLAVHVARKRFGLEPGMDAPKNERKSVKWRQWFKRMDVAGRVHNNLGVDNRI